MARGGSRRRSRRRRQAEAQPLPRPRGDGPPVAGESASSASLPSTQAVDVGGPAGPTASPPSALPVRPQRAEPRPTTAPGRGRERGRLYRLTHPRLISEIISELRKVVWPSRQETRNLTTVVVIIAVAVGALLGGVDWVFNRVMENVLLS